MMCGKITSLSIRRFWGKRGKMGAKKEEEGLILRLENYCLYDRQNSSTDL